MNTPLKPLSTLLLFSFYELTYYLDVEVTSPHSRELPEKCLGMVTNVGDSLTYRDFAPDITIFSRFVMRSTLDNINIYQRALNISGGGIINNVCLQDQGSY